MLTLLSRIFASLYGFLGLTSQQYIHLQFKEVYFYLFIYFCSTSLYVLSELLKILLPVAPPVPFDRLTQLRKGPYVTAPWELETAQEGGLWVENRRLGERPLVTAINPPQCEGTMGLNVSAAAVRKPGSRRLLCPPPSPPLTPASPECGMQPLLILLEKFQFDRNAFWQEPVPSECQFSTTCAVYVSKNLSLTRSHELLPFLFLVVCACLVEEGCDSRMLLLLFFHIFLCLSGVEPMWVNATDRLLRFASDQHSLLPQFQPLRVWSLSATSSSLPAVGSSAIDCHAGGRCIYRWAVWETMKKKKRR